MPNPMNKLAFLALCFLSSSTLIGQETIQILNFQGDSGYQHDSKDEAIQLVESLGKKNGWEVFTTADAHALNESQLSKIDVVIFNNNCGTESAIFSTSQARALQNFIRNGGGFMGIHCAGAIWHEEKEFQAWYEQLIGTLLVGHPEVQNATLVIENSDHNSTSHLPKQWQVKDEWHYFSSNPRGRVNVLLSLDENSYKADSSLKMGDHPFTWYQYFDGGRSFFTSLGHTVEIYQNADYQRLIEGGILWAANISRGKTEPALDGLILDLDADHNVVANEKEEILKWTNGVALSQAQDFTPNGYGVRITNPESGRPTLKRNIPEIKGHNAIVFKEDELINEKEDAFDYLLTGSGYTWFTVLKPYKTQSSEEQTAFGLHRLKDVNSFLGNLRNGGNYEGLWGSLNDDLTVWCGSRNGITFGRFDQNNPKITGTQLQSDKYYVIGARMGSGTGEVAIELFVNKVEPVASGRYPVNIDSNPSKLAIGTERDATNHPGSESFDGEIARLLIYERPLDDSEMAQVLSYLKSRYGLTD